MADYFEELYQKYKRERETHERITKRKQQEWRNSLERRRQEQQEQESIRFQIKYQHAGKSQMKRQAEIAYIAKRGREIYNLQRDPVYQAEQKQLRRFREWRLSARKRKLGGLGSGDEDLERRRERIREEDAAKWEMEIRLCVEEYERRNPVEVKWGCLAIWVLSILSVGLAVFAWVS